jgi:integrase
VSRYNSNFSVRFEDFVSEKKALGFDYGYAIPILRNFDNFCRTLFRNESILTKEICLTWATRGSNESMNSMHTRIAPIREFAKYLVRIGEKAYVLPEGLAKSGAMRAPYIFTEREVKKIWNAFDNMKQDTRFPLRHITMPLVFRVLYCCGLRPAEAIKLQISDFDFKTDCLNIRKSKRSRDRKVFMPHELTEMVISFRHTTEKILPFCKWLFPKSTGEMYASGALNYNFRHVCSEANICWSENKSPRVYDFRHTFATHRLYRWMKEGVELTAVMPYLSTFMGHETLTETEYYIHFVPEIFNSMTDYDYSKLQLLLPVVPDYE